MTAADGKLALAFVLNDEAVEAAVAPYELLIDMLRTQFGLTGTKRSCDVEVCGACTVLVDGLPISSCTTLAADVDGRAVRTIEGLGGNGELSRVQRAFVEHAGLQCGFCTPGMVMSALDIVRRRGKRLDEATIRAELDGNLCRCTGYHNIVKAIQAGAAGM